MYIESLYNQRKYRFRSRMIWDNNIINQNGLNLAVVDEENCKSTVYPPLVGLDDLLGLEDLVALGVVVSDLFGRLVHFIEQVSSLKCCKVVYCSSRP